jgi:hypothetical protein
MRALLDSSEVLPKHFHLNAFPQEPTEVGIAWRYLFSLLLSGSSIPLYTSA